MYHLLYWIQYYLLHVNNNVIKNPRLCRDTGIPDSHTKLPTLTAK